MNSNFENLLTHSLILKRLKSLYFVIIKRFVFLFQKMYFWLILTCSIFLSSAEEEIQEQTQSSGWKTLLSNVFGEVFLRCS